MLQLLRKLLIPRRPETRAGADARAAAAGAAMSDPVIETVPMLMEELEPRILHSADLSPLFDGDANLATLQDHQPLSRETSDVEPASSTE